MLKCVGMCKQNDKVTCNYIAMVIVHACNNYTIVPCVICMQQVATVSLF